MPDLWMDVDAALSEVPVNVMPLIDDTDFKTIEAAVAYNAAGMALYWHFVTTAGAYSVTAVTPTTGGDYDWTDQGDAGIYTIEIPASGGASINNDTEGFGWFTGVCTGVLPWRGPTIGFRAATLNNALIDGGDVLDVNVTEIGGVAQSATDLKDFADTGYDPSTHKVQGVVLTDTATSVTNGVTLANDAITAAKFDETTAFPLAAADSGATQIARVGADGDTLETLSDQIDLQATAAKLLAYVQLLARSDAAIETDNAADLIEINADGGSGAGNFSAQTDSVEALRDQGDSAWITATGFMPSTEDGSSFTAIPWNATWDAEVQSEVADGLNAAIPASPAAGSMNAYIQQMKFVMKNKMAITEASGDTVVYKDDGTTPYCSVAAAFTTDSTTTTRKALE